LRHVRDLTRTREPAAARERRGRFLPLPGKKDKKFGRPGAIFLPLLLGVFSSQARRLFRASLGGAGRPPFTVGCPPVAGSRSRDRLSGGGTGPPRTGCQPVGVGGGWDGRGSGGGRSRCNRSRDLNKRFRGFSGFPGNLNVGTDLGAHLLERFGGLAGKRGKRRGGASWATAKPLLRAVAGGGDGARGGRSDSSIHESENPPLGLQKNKQKTKPNKPLEGSQPGGQSKAPRASSASRRFQEQGKNWAVGGTGPNGS